MCFTNDYALMKFVGQISELPVIDAGDTILSLVD
jgi:hypothetical protein